MSIGLKYRGNVPSFTEREVKGVPFLEIPMFAETNVVKHGFSTRVGGVSREHLASMNLSFTRGDDPENVTENYRRFAAAIGVKPEKMVASFQTHTDHVRRVTARDLGKGITREKDYTDVDGLVTDIPGACLVTYYADCVPVLFVDPVKRVVASSHSGWRGTVKGIGARTVEIMRDEYGCDPEDILAATGPSICQSCYEVSEDVILQFADAFAGHEDELFYRKDNGKYQLDLWKANELVVLGAGVRPDHFTSTNLCTCCNKDLLFSHRASGGLRGNLAAFIALSED